MGLADQYDEPFFGAFMAAVYPGMPRDENPADIIEYLASEQPEQEGKIMRQNILYSTQDVIVIKCSIKPIKPQICVVLTIKISNENNASCSIIYQLMSSVIYDNWDPCQGNADGASAPSGPPCKTGMAYDMNEFCYAVSKTLSVEAWAIGTLVIVHIINYGLAPVLICGVPY